VNYYHNNQLTNNLYLKCEFFLLVAHTTRLTSQSDFLDDPLDYFIRKAKELIDLMSLLTRTIKFTANSEFKNHLASLTKLLMHLKLFHLPFF